MQDTKHFYNEWVDRLSEVNDRHRKVFNGLERCNLYAGKRVLDLGCGTGITSIYMARQDCLVTGVDFAEKLIEYAEAHNSNKNTTYIVGDITDLDLEQPFDLICLTDVLEHIDPAKIQGVMETVQKHSHSMTVVYVNLPYHLFTEYGRGKFEEQPIETALPLQLILSMMDGMGFAAMDILTYGLKSPVEYIEICFVTRQNLFLMWEHYYNPQPESSDEDVPEEGAQEKENN